MIHFFADGFPAWVDWGLPAAVVVVAVVTVLIRSKGREQRRAFFRRLTKEMGLRYVREGEGVLWELLNERGLFDKGDRERVTYLLYGPVKDTIVHIFDFEYSRGAGKNRCSSSQTVVAFKLKGRLLPDFDLRPENLLHRIGSALGYEDIDLPHRPEFSRKYLLRGKDEAAVLDAFSGDVAVYLEQRDGLSIESYGDWLVVYRAEKLLMWEQVSELVDTAFGVCERIVPRG